MKRENIESIYELTTSQKGMLFHSLKEENEAYIGQHSLVLKNKIDEVVFERSLRILAKKYEIFRARVVHNKMENPVQVILKESSLEFTYLEGENAEEYARKDRERGFQLEKENLIRVSLLKKTDEVYENIWTFHHILIDGYCIAILARDFFDIYYRLLKKERVEEKAAVPYKNYVKWLKQQDMEQGRKYWESYVEVCNTPGYVPYDRREQQGSNREKCFLFSKSESASIMAMAKKRNVTVNAIMQTMWGTLLALYNNTSDVIFGNVMSARPFDLKDSDKMVGLFAGTYPVRVNYKQQDSVMGMVIRLNREFIDAVKYSYFSIGDSGEVSKNIRSIYVYENYDMSALYQGIEKAGLELLENKMKDHSNYDLSISFAEIAGSLQFLIRYVDNRYSEDAINTVAKDFVRIVKRLYEDEKVSLDQLGKYITYKSTLENQEDTIEKTSIQHVAPETELEKRLASIFTEVIGVENPSVNDDFFELGGDSILGMKLVAKCQKEGLSLSLKELFGNSSIRGLADVLASKKEAEVKKLVKYEPDQENHNAPFPLNEIQSAYVMGMNVEFELGGFTTQYYTEVEGDYDYNRLNQAFVEVIKHQPALRTTIDDITSQHVREDIEKCQVLYEDISRCGDEEQEKIMQEWRASMSKHEFSLEEFPYVIIKAFQCAAHKLRICFLVECVCIDGAGLVMLLEELSHFYEHPERPLKPITFTFRDYQMARVKEQEKKQYEIDKKFWLSKVDSIPLGPELPMVGDSRSIKNPGFLRQEYLIKKERYDELKELCRENKITMASLLCTAYMQVLSFWSGSQEFSINMTVFERNMYHEDVSRLIGDFTKLIVVDTKLEHENILKQSSITTQTIAEALEHSSFNCVNLIKEIAKGRKMGTRAILPYVFTCALMDEKKSNFEPSYSISRTPQVYIDCQVTEKEGNLFINWDYPEGLFEETMIMDMFQQYASLIENAMEQTTLQAPIQMQEFVKRYNETESSKEKVAYIEQTTLPDLFVPSFEKYADRTAVVDSEKSWTYKQLEGYVYKVAAKLKQNGVASGMCVGIMGERKAETVAAILAILICGGTYVPINMAYPKERIDYIMKKINGSICVDSEYVHTAFVQEDAQRIVHEAKPENLAYVIFTSGTTGHPKGVAIQHKAVVNTILDINERCQISERDSFIGLAEFGFDLSVYDVFGAMSSGAKLCIVENQRNPEEILGILQKEKITFWNSVPAVMQMLTGVVEREFVNTDLRNVYLSGDWIPMQLPDNIRKHFCNARVTSLGGATEASIWSIYYPTEREHTLNSVPYGMPLKNQSIYILDDKLRVCPVGIRGQICIGGIGVAAGYYGEKEKTEAAFVDHKKLGRIYLTGDYGKMHWDGYVEFMGRMDNQTKLRGYRVELGEIEVCAMEIEAVKEAVVVIKKMKNGEALVMYVVGTGVIDESALEKYLRRRLPDYMIPTIIRQIDKLPITGNGKVDRKALQQEDLEVVKKQRLVPNTEEEKVLGKYIGKFLDIEQVDYEQNFFELGIDSLKAVVLINELKQVGYNFTLNDLYESYTIAMLAERVQSKVKEETDDADMYEDGEI